MPHDLSSLYRDFFKSAAISDSLASRLSCPLLLSAGPRWHEASRRVLFVGQETRGWDWAPGSYYPWPHPPLKTLADFRRYADAVRALVDGYAAFAFSRYQPANRNGPFWRAFHLLFESVNRDGCADMLWTNLFRCDVQGGSVLSCSAGELQELMAFQRGLLTREIRLLAPTAVLFFTGHGYDFELQAEFVGAVTSTVAGRAELQFARITHPALPAMTVRTYHPSYLRRSPERWSWLEDLARDLTR